MDAFDDEVAEEDSAAGVSDLAISAGPAVEAAEKEICELDSNPAR